MASNALLPSVASKAIATLEMRMLQAAASHADEQRSAQ